MNKRSQHAFTDLVARCLLAGLCTGALSALLLTLAVLLLATGYSEPTPPVWP